MEEEIKEDNIEELKKKLRTYKKEDTEKQKLYILIIGILFIIRRL